MGKSRFSFPLKMDVSLTATVSHSQFLGPTTGSDSLWVQLPTSLPSLADLPKIYNKITIEGDQVPGNRDGLLLSGDSYGLLDDEEKGDILYSMQRATPLIGRLPSARRGKRGTCASLGC